MSFNDLSGRRFGKLLVIARAEDDIRPNGRREIQYTCLCECGNTKVVKRKNLMNGHAKTCGCRGRSTTEVETYLEQSGVCIYSPFAVNCSNNRRCNTCGWNPDNTKLRKERINKLLRKDGTDE